MKEEELQAIAELPNDLTNVEGIEAITKKLDNVRVALMPFCHNLTLPSLTTLSLAVEKLSDFFMLTNTLVQMATQQTLNNYIIDINVLNACYLSAKNFGDCFIHFLEQHEKQHTFNLNQSLAYVNIARNFTSYVLSISSILPIPESQSLSERNFEMHHKLAECVLNSANSRLTSLQKSQKSKKINFNDEMTLIGNSLSHVYISVDSVRFYSATMASNLYRMKSAQLYQFYFDSRGFFEQTRLLAKQDNELEKEFGSSSPKSRNNNKNNSPKSNKNKKNKNTNQTHSPKAITQKLSTDNTVQTIPPAILKDPLYIRLTKIQKMVFNNEHKKPITELEKLEKEAESKGNSYIEASCLQLRGEINFSEYNKLRYKTVISWCKDPEEAKRIASEMTKALRSSQKNYNASIQIASNAIELLGSDSPKYVYTRDLIDNAKFYCDQVRDIQEQDEARKKWVLKKFSDEIADKKKKGIACTNPIAYHSSVLMSNNFNNNMNKLGNDTDQLEEKSPNTSFQN